MIKCKHISWVIVCSFLLLEPAISMGSTNNSPYFQRYPGEIVKAEVSAGEFSRITLSKGMIFEVIGDESNYQLLSDQLGSNIFIKPHLPVGKSFAISLISNNGLVIDIQLEVKDMGASVIIVDPNSSEGGAKGQMTGGVSLLKEEILMLKNMKLGRKHKYYVLVVSSTLPQERLSGSLRDTQVVKKTIYRFGDLTGAILEVKNNRGQDLILKEEDFSRLFCGSRAVHIENDHLVKKASTRVFVITKEEGKC